MDKIDIEELNDLASRLEKYTKVGLIQPSKELNRHILQMEDLPISNERTYGVPDDPKE